MSSDEIDGHAKALHMAGADKISDIMERCGYPVDREVERLRALQFASVISIGLTM